MMSRPHASELDRRFFRKFLPPVMAVLLAVAAINGWVAYRLVHADLRTDGERLLSLYAASLQKPLWDVDSEAVTGIVQVLGAIPSVRGVVLHDISQKETFSAGLPIKEDLGGILKTDLSYTDNQGRRYLLGQMTIQLLQPALWQTVLSGLTTYLPILAAAFVIVVIAGLVVNRRLVTRPLEVFRQVIEANKAGQAVELPPDKLPHDELGDVMRAYLEESRQRQATERELRQSREDARTIIEAMADPVFIHPWSAAHENVPNFTEVNESARRFLGMTREELLATGPGRLDEMTRERGEHIIEEIESKGSFTFETVFRHKSGEHIPVEVSTSVVEISGRSTAISVARSLVEHKRRERALEDAIAKAEEANVAKSEFIANMSHEIRSPMNAIIGFSEILADSLNDSNKRQEALIIAESGRNLLALVNDILDLSKIEAGRLEIKPSLVALKDFFENILRFFRTQAEDKNLRFDLEVLPELPDYIWLDEIRLRQILVNLIGNALKFTDQGGVTLRVEALVDADVATKYRLVVSVIDSGPGVPDAFKERIFGHFEQIPGQDSATHRGTGLGLSIASHLAGLLGGSVVVQDNPVGRGSIFTLTLPQVTLPVPGNAVEYPSKKRGGAPGSALRFDTHPLVLVVDDMRNNRTLLQAYLETLGFPVAQASDGREALEVAETRLPGLILTDIRMPVIDGREFLRRLRESSQEQLHTVPVVAITASAMPGQVTRDQTLFDGHLVKPVSLRTLAEEMAKLLPHHFDLLESSPDLFQNPSEVADPVGLLAEMDFALEKEIQAVQKLMRIKDATALAARLQATGTRYGAPFLVQASEQLAQASQSFQVAAMMKQLDSVLAFVRGLRSSGA